MSVKQERMADKIREIMSELLFTEVTDPALKNLTVTKVDLDAELEYADIYVNALGNEARQKEVLRGLERANGFLRRELGARIRLRRTPVLHFHWDLSLGHADRIERRLSTLGGPEPTPSKAGPAPASSTEDPVAPLGDERADE
jgi:ribosome-binding factor A